MSLFYFFCIQVLSFQFLTLLQNQQYKEKMVRKTIKEGIKAFDFFKHPATFRYGEEPEYESLTGGIVSIIMIIIFAIIFFNTVMQTIKKVSIDHKDTTVQEQDPSFYQIGTDNFMFAIGITDLDLNSGQRWFDIYMESRTYTGASRTKTKVNLTKCNKQQWTKLKPQMQTIYDKLQFDKWLCPSEGTVLELQGKFSSDVFKFYKVGVVACNSTSDPYRPCTNSSNIDNYINLNEDFIFNFYFLNTILNPTNQQYISTFLDDSNYYTFTPTIGMSTNFYMSTYSITTDESIWPVQNKQTKTGGISDTATQSLVYYVKQKDYLKFYIRKSSLTLTMDRTFRKIDQTLSYIGGLFSSIVVLLFIVSKYNQISYQMQVAKNLFHYSKNKPLKSDEFNFLVFLGYLVYVFFTFLCINLPWKKMETYCRSLQEVRKQMDIRLVMKKVLYAERMAIAVFDQPKAKILHLQEPLTLEQAEQIRKDYRFYDKLQKRFFDYKKIRAQQRQKNQQINKQEVKKQTDVKISSDNLYIGEINLNLGQDQNFQQKKKSSLSIEEPINEPKNGMTRSGRKKTFIDTVHSILTDDKDKKQEQFNQMIEKIKVHVRILQEQAEKGDIVSKKILNRFDPKLMHMFVDKSEPKQMQIQKNPNKTFSSKQQLNVLDGKRNIIQNIVDESI